MGKGDPPRVFINYRTKDTGPTAARLEADLRRNLVHGSVFLDHREIRGGEEWPERLRAEVDRATVMISVIGTSWLKLQDPETFEQMIARPGDWVRHELERAFSRGVEVLPVLVEGSSRPTERQLRNLPGIARLAKLQDVPLRTKEWDHDLEVILEWLVARGFRRTPRLTLERAGDPVEIYRKHLVAAHSRLIPFVPELSDQLLDEVAVELELEVGPRLWTTDFQFYGTAPGLAAGLREPYEFVSIGKVTVSTDWVRELEQSSLTYTYAVRGATLGIPLDMPLGISREKAPRWLVLGDPGAGKTTIARNLARRLAEDADGPLPVFTSVTRLAEHSGDLATLAAAEVLADDAGRNALAAFLRGRLKDPAGVRVLLDGFDEVPDGLRQTAWDRIDELASELEHTPIAVLSRPIAFERREVWPGFGKATVRSLDDDRQRTLVGNLVYDDALADEILVAAGAHPRLAELARNPLLLTLLTIVGREAIREGRGVPAGVGRLFAEAIRLLLRRGFALSPRGVRDVTAAKDVLQALSLELHRRGGETWPREDLAGVIWDLCQGACEDTPDSDKLHFRFKETWGTPEPFLDDIGHQAGILGPHDGPRERWRYLHRALREYLAAERLAMLPDGMGDALYEEWLERVREVGAKDRGLAEWAEVYSLYLGVTEAPPARLEELARVSKGLASRTLRGQEHVAADDRLRLVLDADEDDGKDLLDALRGHPDPDRAAELLWERVVGGAGMETLGRLHWALDAIEQPADRKDFFGACGAWDESASPTVGFVRIPAGEFSMGAPEGESGSDEGERPVHRVRVPAFELAATPLTKDQYRGFAELLGTGPDPGEADLPAVEVSWWAARLFCAWIGGRLPTEAEWEYACRAGTTTRFHPGDDEERLLECGWFFRNSGKSLLPPETDWDWEKVRGEWECRVRPVGGKKANAFGLFDTHGNVFEWCEDRWHNSFEGAPVDGSAWVDGGSSERVVRGGGWINPAEVCRSAYRYRARPGLRIVGVGFRPAATLPSDS